MKHLQSFRLFEARASRLPSGLTPRQEAFLNRYIQGTWSVNQQTGLVDVRGNFHCYETKMKNLLGISFGHVSGYFMCHLSGLTTLAGAPRTVGGDFYCPSNELTSLVGAPQTVGGDFYCGKNQLTTLVGGPQKVGGAFDCSYNQLTSLAGAPQKVGRDFSCYNNRLTTLEGAPQTVGGYFSCNRNRLTSLEGAPQTVGGIFQSNSFELKQGNWNPSGWEKILTTGNAAAQKLMKTLPWTQPDWWNSELQRDPGKTVHLLAPWWNHMPEDLKSKIVIPPGYENEFGLFSGFDELGLF